MMRPPPRSPLFPYPTLFRSQPDRVSPHKEGVLDGMEQAPLRVGEPVLTVEARAAVKADDGGNAACELLAVALRHAEGSHNGISTAIYREIGRASGRGRG